MQEQGMVGAIPVLHVGGPRLVRGVVQLCMAILFAWASWRSAWLLWR